MVHIWVIPGLTLPTPPPPERKANNPVVITPINNVTGTIIEATDRISIKSAQWTLVTFFDLSQLARQCREPDVRMQDLEASLPEIKVRSHAADRYLPHAVSELVVVASHIRRVQDAVLNVLIGAHEGNLSPALVSVEQVNQVITKIQTHLPPGRRLPITSETARDLYRLATTRVQETEDLLMFHTSVPLVEEDEFTVYRMESIPQITREGLVITKTETKYLAVDDHRKHHFAINQEHLSQCISGTNGNKVCEFKQTLLGPDAHQLPCTMAALSRHRARECKPEPIKGTSYWVQLTEQNAWIFGTTKPITMTYVCSDEKDQIIIDGVGKLTIRQDCVIQSPTITLLGRAQFNSSGTIRMSGSYVHEGPSHEKIRTTEGQLEATLDQLDQLHAEVQGLKTWTKQAQEEVDNEADWNLVHQYSGVIMSGVAILIAAWAGYTR
ncbi:uncharacterized protein Dana_GF28044 [Drosophila ananassae]|uniref:Envelope protein n=1 Tax=Drosophila ananassae TaxID=7217 RepID=A0A0P9AXQ3_DROAN|nr:uncharacterized protein Dana_GF28044 [Drosophila ananassae]